MFLLILYIILSAFIITVLSIYFFYIVFKGYAPFLLTKEKVLDSIIKELKIDEEDSVYELGCGNAGFLRAVEKEFPHVKELIGAEYFFFPYYLASMQISLLKSKIKILKKDFFNLDLSDADVIYCFLNMNTMAKLKEKFKKECQVGTQIVSYQFTIPNWKPFKVIDLNNDEKDRVYFYKV